MINASEYGEKHQDHLLDQYKLYVEMADRISSRRLRTNQFYISVLSGILTLLSIFIKNQSLPKDITIYLILLSFICTVLCGIWYANIVSYKQLNKIKFEVIHEIEKHLPYACYENEWKIEKQGKNRYIRLTKIENFIPVIMACPYILLLIYSFTIL